MMVTAAMAGKPKPGKRLRRKRYLYVDQRKPSRLRHEKLLHSLVEGGADEIVAVGDCMVRDPVFEERCEIRDKLQAGGVVDPSGFQIYTP